MPWSEVSMIDQRREFVELALQEGVNRRELCRRFGISPEIGYKWIRRWQAGDRHLVDRSHRPCRSPARSSPELEAMVLDLRASHPTWGARKLAWRLKDAGSPAPAISTVHAILVRNGKISPSGDSHGPARCRFEKEAPNELWQMDFKGYTRLSTGARCYPLTVIDDHSRYSLCLAACANEQGATVKQQLEKTFRHYGLPQAVFVDNGSPWGNSMGEGWTSFGVWLLKLGVEVIHSRPYHPQSRGKSERFHRTLKGDVFALRRFADLAAVQHALDRFRDIYNFERPHEALNMQVPAARYRPSRRRMPDRLPQIEYDDRDVVRTVGVTKTYVSFKGRLWKVPEAFRGERVAIRPTNCDGQYGVYFASFRIAGINMA